MIAIVGTGERYLLWCLFVLVTVATIFLFRRLRPKQGAIIGIFILCVVDILHWVRPSFTHPQTHADTLVRAAVAMLFFPMMFGIFLPLLSIADNVCKRDQRKAYVRSAMLNDFLWFCIALLSMYLSFQFAW